MPKSREFPGVTREGYRTFSVTTVDDLIHFLKNCRSTFIFRGQADSKWPLETRITRRILRVQFRGPSTRSSERLILEHFQRRAHHFVDSASYPDEDDDLQWLSLIQHYGGPTRLLDFTRSIFIAAHFAVGVQSETENAAIWAVNLSVLEMNWLQFRDDCDSEFAGHIPEGKTYRNRYGEPRFIYPNPEDKYVVRAAVYGGFSPKAVCPVEPAKANRRIIQQQAVFLLPLDIGQSFDENLAEMYEPRLAISHIADSKEGEIETAPPLTACPEIADCALLKLIIPNSSYNGFQEMLRQMNITADTLFPDLDGLTRSLEEFIPRI